MKALLTVTFAFLLCFFESATARVPRVVTISLYGQSFSAVLPDAVATLSIKTAGDDAALEHQVQALQASLLPLVKQFRETCITLRWNDWLCAKLAVAFAKSAWRTDAERTVGACALLRAMGYNAILTLAQNRFYLATQISRPIYFGAMFRLGQKGEQIFALLDIEKNTVLKSMPKGEMELLSSVAEMQNLRALSLEEPLLPIFPNKPISKTLAWKFQEKEFAISVTYNQNLIEYLADYPQMEVGWYFNQPLTSTFKAQVIEPLRKLIRQQNLTGAAAVDFLLQFCLARPYLEDGKQARGEHCSFVEESFFDAYTDCEDRAYLLAALVHGVLGYEVIGLQFPNHVAIAVQLPEKIETGKKIIFEGKTYTVCDPSYLGSTVGDIIEPFVSALPQSIIKIDKIKFVD